VVKIDRIDSFGALQDGTMWYIPWDIPLDKKWDERIETKGTIHVWEDYIIASIPSKMTTHVMDTTIHSGQPTLEYAESTVPAIIKNLQITKISPSVIETRKQTYPVTLTLIGKGFSQVNEISFSWRGPDSGGPKIWKKGDKNWVNSLKIKSDEEMTVNIYVLRNEPPTNEVKEWTWTVTLKNDKGENATKEFKVRQLPIEYSEPPMLPTPSGSDTKRQQIPSTTETVIVSSKAKKIIKPSQLIFYRRQYAYTSGPYVSAQIWGKMYEKGYILYFYLGEGGQAYKQNPEVDFILPNKGRLQGVLGLLDRTLFVEVGVVGSEAVIGIYGDGKLIKTYSLQVGKPPQIVDLDVTGIERLTIRLENYKEVYRILRTIGYWNELELGFVDILSEEQ
jgi:hypothetical protein